MKYKCRCCEFKFESMNEIPYCPSCECEQLEEIPFNDDKYILPPIEESHHIWLKFMNNINGVGEQFNLDKKTHSVLHGNIMKWVWEYVREEDKEKVIKHIIRKSKNFIGVKNDS